MPETFDSDELSGITASRRAFLKKLAIGAAFAVPVVTSFGMGKSDAAVGPGVRRFFWFGGNQTIGGGGNMSFGGGGNLPFFGGQAH